MCILRTVSRPSLFLIMSLRSENVSCISFSKKGTFFGTAWGFKFEKLRIGLCSPPSSAEVNNAWRYTSILKYVFMEWCLVKYRDDIECDTGSLPRIKKGVVLNEAQYFMTYGTGITNSGFHRLHTHDNYRAPCGLLVTEDQTMEPIRTHSVYELWAAKTPL